MIEKELNKDSLNPIVINMIKNNNIKNILDYKIIDNKITYDIDGKITLNEIIGNKMKPNEVIKLINSLSEILIELESYMISSENIYLSLENIYTNQIGEIFLMINPSLNINNDIKSFYQKIYLDKIIEIEEDSLKLIKINNYLNSNNYSVSGINKLILKLNNETKIKEEEGKEAFIDYRDKRSEKEKLENKKTTVKISTFFNRLFSSKDNNIINQKNI